MDADALRGLLASIERARPTIRRLILANLYAVLALELTIGGAFYLFWPVYPELALSEIADDDDAVPQTYTTTNLATTSCMSSAGNTLTIPSPGSGSTYVTRIDADGASMPLAVPLKSRPGSPVTVAGPTANTNGLITACWYTAP